MNIIYDKKKTALRFMDLLYLSEVFKQKSFSLAAVKYSTTQPAISHAVARVEIAFGVKLFERKNNGVETTPIGQQFQNQIERILTAYSNLNALCVEPIKVESIRIGVCKLYEKYYTAQIVGILSQTFPNLKASFVSGYLEDFFPALDDGRMDIFIGPLIGRRARTSSFRLFNDRIYLVMPDKTPVDSATGRVNEKLANSLSALPFLSPRKRSRFRQICLRINRQLDLLPQEVIEVDTFDTLCYYASAGLGFGYIPMSVLSKIGASLQGVHILELPESISVCPMGIVFQPAALKQADIMRILYPIRDFWPPFGSF